MRACGNFAFGDVAAMIVLVLLGLASMYVRWSTGMLIDGHDDVTGRTASVASIARWLFALPVCGKLIFSSASLYLLSPASLATLMMANGFQVDRSQQTVA